MAATEPADPRLTAPAVAAPGDLAPGEAPVGLVLVSHSAQLAEGAAELARAMAGEEVRIVAAGGMEPPETALGTDAVRVAAAIEAAWSERGVLVLMDLGSALLSAEMAVELLPEERRGRVLLSAAPLVEGAVSAAVTARLGEPLERVALEATGSLDAKRAQVGGPGAGGSAGAGAVLRHHRGRDRRAGDGAAPGPDPRPRRPRRRDPDRRGHPPGLHARPAARVIRATGGMDAVVLAGNATTGSALVSARSLNALAGLQVREGHELLVRATGPDAQRAIDALRALAARRYDEPAGAPTAGAIPTERAPAPSPAGPAPPPASAPGRPGELRGIPASAGIAIGTLQVLEEAEAPIPTGEADRTGLRAGDPGAGAGRDPLRARAAARPDPGPVGRLRGGDHRRGPALPRGPRAPRARSGGDHRGAPDRRPGLVRGFDPAGEVLGAARRPHHAAAGRRPRGGEPPGAPSPAGPVRSRPPRRPGSWWHATSLPPTPRRWTPPG